jgi:hypothetical protein
LAPFFLTLSLAARSGASGDRESLITRRLKTIMMMEMPRKTYEFWKGEGRWGQGG